MSERLASVSVDLDGLEHYYAIHGIPDSRGGGQEGRSEVYEKALPRFGELFAELGIRATLFAIGRDLSRPASADALRRARAAGHEIANHSFSHRYDLVRCSDGDVDAEIVRGDGAIRAAIGEGAIGFRAPGYNVDERVLATCRRLGYAYDSSVFPSYPYYFAKAAVMAALRARGRRSGAALGGPKVLLAPTTPYYPDPYDYRRRARPGSLVELPIALVPGLRFPFIGTWICLWSDRTFDLAYRLVRRRGFLNLELHGIELLGLEEDGLDPELRRQPDLRVSLGEKRRKLLRALAKIRADYEVVTLAEAARRLQSSVG